MVDKTNTRGEVKRVRVHDVIRQFCMNEARELNLLREVRFPPSQRVFCPEPCAVGEYRRICLHSAVVEFLNQKPPITKVRSFICFSKKGFNVPVNSTSEVFNQFQLIRVFEGSAIKFPRYTDALVQLIHLRYLALSFGEGVKLLSNSICSLWFLETLVITTASKSFQVNNLLELKRLRHVKTNSALVLGGKGKNADVEVNQNLQTLTRLSTGNCTSEILERTCNLRTLGIRGDIDSILDITYLQNLTLLSKLKLKNDVDTEKELFRAPSSTFFPIGLKSLTLEATNWEWKYMDLLGTLKKLENLKLKENAFMGEAWSFEGNGFNYDIIPHYIIFQSNGYKLSISDNKKDINCLT